TVVALIMIGAAIVALHGNVWAILALAVFVTAILFGSLASIDRTLKAHPELALMDGSEILSLRKAEMAAKNRATVDLTPAIPDMNERKFFICEVDMKNRTGWLPSSVWDWINIPR